MSAIFDEIYQQLKDIEIIDSHEHLPSWENKYDRDNDFLAECLPPYFEHDLLTAGMPVEIRNKIMSRSLDIQEKWKLLEPYWECCCHTGYGQVISIAARDLYGVEHIDSTTIEALEAAFQAGKKTINYQHILKEKCHIHTAILDTPPKLEPEYTIPDETYFKPVRRVNSMIIPRSILDIYALEKESGMIISSFEDYLETCRLTIKKYMSHAIGLKCSVAYYRSLAFPRVTYQEAELEFNEMISTKYYEVPEERVFSANQKFQNYMMHYILGLAQKYETVLQIHTGYQAGNGNLIEHSNPALLSNLILQYPGVKFDIFHVGYPYQQELGAMVKMYPNVYADFCWAFALVPTIARKALGEWLEIVPYNKIIGFGGDYTTLLGVYGHQYLARESISQVLAEKVKGGIFRTEEAVKAGKAILFDNAAKLYGIQ